MHRILAATLKLGVVSYNSNQEGNVRQSLAQFTTYIYNTHTHTQSCVVFDDGESFVIIDLAKFKILRCDSLGVMRERETRAATTHTTDEEH